MLKCYKKVKEWDIIFNTVVLFLLFVCFPLVLPLSLIFGFVLFLINRYIKLNFRTIFVACSASFIVLLITLLILSDAFLYSQLAVLRASINNMLSLDFIRNLLMMKYYNIHNLIFCFMVSLEFSTYAHFFIYDKANLKKAGVKSFKKEVDDISSGEKSSKEHTGVYLGMADRKKVYCNKSHVFVTGTTGCGKTVLISNYILHCAKEGLPCLIVDGKGDTDAGSIKVMVEKACQKYNKELYIINMTDDKISEKYNPFTAKNATVIKDMLINMTDWTEPHYKLNCERYLQRLLNLLLLKSEKLDFKIIVKYMDLDNFVELSLELLKENKITKEEHLENCELIKASGKDIGGAIARFATMQEGVLGNIFHENGMDIFSALKRNAVILFVLNPLLYPEVSSSFGRLVLVDAKMAVSRLFKEKTKHTFFIFDEINVYVSKTFLDILNKSRSAHVQCLLAMQSIADLDCISESFKNQIVENCNNFIFMRQNSFKSAEECSMLIGTTETMKMTYKVSDEGDSTGDGSARKVREFIVHPDNIKKLKRGEAIYLNKENDICTELKVNMPNL